MKFRKIEVIKTYKNSTDNSKDNFCKRRKQRISSKIPKFTTNQKMPPFKQSQNSKNKSNSQTISCKMQRTPFLNSNN